MFLHPGASPLPSPPRGGTKSPINPPPNGPNLLSMSCLPPPSLLGIKGVSGEGTVGGLLRRRNQRQLETPFPQAG